MPEWRRARSRRPGAGVAYMRLTATPAVLQRYGRETWHRRGRALTEVRVLTFDVLAVSPDRAKVHVRYRGEDRGIPRQPAWMPVGIFTTITLWRGKVGHSNG